MVTKAQVEDLMDEILYEIEEGVEQRTFINHDICRHAAEKGFKVADVNIEVAISLITPKLQELVAGYLEHARETEENNQDE